MKKVFVLLFTLSLIVLLASCNNSQPNTNDTTQPTTETNDPTAVQSSESISDETDAPVSSTNVPEQWHVFEYDGVKYDLWEIYSEVQAVSEWERVGRYVVVKGYVNANNSIFAFINTETQKIEFHLVGSVLTYHSDDISTILFAHHNFAHYHTIRSLDGTLLADLELDVGEYIRELTYSEDKTQVIVTIETPDSTLTKTMNLKPAGGGPEHSYTSDMYNFIPENASSVPKVTTLITGKVILTYETEEKLPLVYFGQVVDAETVRVTKTEFAAPEFEYTACEVMDYLYEGGHNVYAVVRFTQIDGAQIDVYYYGCMTENVWEVSDYSYKWTVFRAEDANALNLARGQYD